MAELEGLDKKGGSKKDRTKYIIAGVGVLTLIVVYLQYKRSQSASTAATAYPASTATGSVPAQSTGVGPNDLLSTLGSIANQQNDLLKTIVTNTTPSPPSGPSGTDFSQYGQFGTFIANQYQLALGRAPTPGEVVYHENLIEQQIAAGQSVQGAQNEDVLGIFNSPQAQDYLKQQNQKKATAQPLVGSGGASVLPVFNLPTHQEMIGLSEPTPVKYWAV